MPSYFPSTTSLNLPNKFAVTADMTSATWNTVAAHTVATTTGTVHCRVLIRCGSTLTDAADLASIQFGVGGSTALIIASAGAAGLAGKTIATNTLWFSSAAESNLQIANVTVGTIGQNYAMMDIILSGGLSLAYEITTAALTGGNLVFEISWEPMGVVGGTMAAGTGS